MPITIYLNYEINILSILNNIILVPFVSSIVFPLSLITFFIPIMLPIFQILTNVLLKINIIFDTYSIMLIVGKISILEVIIYYIILLLLISSKRKVFMAIFLLYLTLVYNKNIFDNNYYVYYIDVGQGDSALLVSPKKKETILIDTGGKITYSKEEWQERIKEFNLSDNIVLFLKSLRIRSINLLIMTHGDADHIGYAKRIIDNIKVKNVLVNNGDLSSLEENIVKKVKSIENYKSKYFNYQLLNNNLYTNENDNSIVSLFKIYSYSFLFMGDASINVEKDLLKTYNLTKIDFLKVGHHGSNTSTSAEFIKKIKPTYSIISVGKNNRYGHPKAEVLKILEESNIYRTDLSGTIEVKINKNKFKISTCAP
jgi:competence protein ComEC